MKDAIYAGILTIFGSGLLYAADQRIDARVSKAINDFQRQEITRQIDFYDTKQELAPDTVTPDDRVNRKVLERQLRKLEGGQ